MRAPSAKIPESLLVRFLMTNFHISRKNHRVEEIRDHKSRASLVVDQGGERT